jgi:hypothetical protein
MMHGRPVAAGGNVEAALEVVPVGKHSDARIEGLLHLLRHEPEVAAGIPGREPHAPVKEPLAGKIHRAAF